MPLEDVVDVVRKLREGIVVGITVGVVNVVQQVLKQDEIEKEQKKCRNNV